MESKKDEMSELRDRHAAERDALYVKQLEELYPMTGRHTREKLELRKRQAAERDALYVKQLIAEQGHQELARRED